MDYPEVMRWQVGDARITRVMEFRKRAVPVTVILEGGTPAAVLSHDWLRPDFADDDGNVLMAVQTFVVESRGLRIIVDTCVGNDKPRNLPHYSNLQTDFLDRFVAAGFPLESIDYVMCTHLHLDHVGWNTRLVDGRWTPTFPNARYLFGRLDYAEISSPDYVDWGGDIFGDSIRPVVEAGQAIFVDPDHVLNDEVRLLPTPGHTPGHAAVLIESRGQEAVIAGDAIHTPFQCAAPDLHTHICEHKEQASATRRKLLGRCCEKGSLFIGNHFPSWTAGRLAVDGTGFRLERPEAGVVIAEDAGPIGAHA